jgi:3-hydroxyisobutyrate dehydrogenase-like beta-hydroxyacid dehydrogenase
MGLMPVVAMLHPGQMGAALAVQARRTGAQVLWCPAGRGAATAERAKAAGLTAVPDLGELLDTAQIVLSVCPPEFAGDVAGRVARHGYGGIFVEANAISPQRCAGIAETLAGAGARVVDGGIIGPPPGDGATSRLYLGGDAAAISAVAEVFRGTAAEPVPLTGGIGAASALKMAFACFNKISNVLAAVSHALAAKHQVTEQLLAEAQRFTGSALGRPGSFPSVAAKAWRWAPEMHEIADTLDADGLPPDLAHAAAAVLARWQDDKDAWGLSVDDVLARLSAR